MSEQQTPPHMYARVTVYKGVLVIEWLTVTSDENCVTPYDRPGNMGYVAMNTNLVGVSDEAYETLKTVRKGRDSIGAIDVWACDDGTYAFATFGGKYVLLDPKDPDAEASRQYQLPARDQFQTIPNDTPEGAREAIDRATT